MAELESQYTQLRSKLEGIDAEFDHQKEQLENESKHIYESDIYFCSSRVAVIESIREFRGGRIRS